jgi:hypothetical protein
LKQVFGDFRLSAAGDGEGLDFHPSLEIFGRLSTQLLIDLIGDGGSRFDFSHPQDHTLNDHFSTTPGISRHVELRSGAIESQTDLYSVGETFLLLEQIQM